VIDVLRELNADVEFRSRIGAEFEARALPD